MSSANATSAEVMQLLRRGLALANHAVVDAIRSQAVRVQLDGNAWHDVRPMLDPREVSGEAIDFNAECLSWAEHAGLVRRHVEHAHLVRIVRRE